MHHAHSILQVVERVMGLVKSDDITKLGGKATKGPQRQLSGPRSKLGGPWRASIYYTVCFAHLIPLQMFNGKTKQGRKATKGWGTS